MNTKLPRVSIIVPVYNNENTIETCIDSILSQSLYDIQVIVVDDGSTDNTYNLIKKKESQDARLTVMKQENAGPSAARNRGLELVEGEFVAFVDSDDIILSEMFCTLLNYQKMYKVDLVISGIRRVVNEKKYIDCNVDRIYYYSQKSEINTNFIDMLSMGINSPVGRIYKSSIIKRYNLKLNEELDVGEDLQFNIDYIDKINSILFIPNIYYQYNTFNSFLSFKYRKDLFDIRKKSIHLLELFLDKNSIEKEIINYLYIKLVYAAAMQEIEYKNNLRIRLYEIKKNIQRMEVKNAVKSYKPIKKTDKIMKIIISLHSPVLIDLLSILFVLIRKSGVFLKPRISV